MACPSRRRSATGRSARCSGSSVSTHPRSPRVTPPSPICRGRRVAEMRKPDCAPGSWRDALRPERAPHRMHARFRAHVSARRSAQLSAVARGLDRVQASGAASRRRSTTFTTVCWRTRRAALLPGHQLSGMTTSSSCTRMMTHPHRVQGIADGGAHLGMICDATAPTHLLAHWTRDCRTARRCRSPGPSRRSPGDRVGRRAQRPRRVGGGYKGDLNVIDYGSLRLHPPMPVQTCRPAAAVSCRRPTVTWQRC